MVVQAREEEEEEEGEGEEVVFEEEEEEEEHRKRLKVGQLNCRKWSDLCSSETLPLSSGSSVLSLLNPSNTSRCTMV